MSQRRIIKKQNIMENYLKLLKNNEKREWKDEQWVQEFFDFLKGDVPETITLQKPLNLSDEDAFLIIWYLQEHFSIIPDNIEKCDNCNTIYDSESSGYYSEEGNEIGHYFCSACDHLAPYDED